MRITGVFVCKYLLYNEMYKEIIKYGIITEGKFTVFSSGFCVGVLPSVRSTRLLMYHNFYCLLIPVPKTL
jgi:hypothetical protein